MKKILACSAVILVLFLCTACSDPPVGSTVIQDAQSYLQVNSFVKQTLDDSFVGFLPAKEEVDLDTADYYYCYECAFFGDPNFFIRLDCKYTDAGVFADERKRIASLSYDAVFMEDGIILYIAKDISHKIDLYMDDEIQDGLSFYFEVAIVNEEDNEITYLVARQQDSNQKIEAILDVLDIIQEGINRTGQDRLTDM